ncbi:MAG: aminotransferase class III-fold pyridoxal phosphate-dependent enzyme, partial [Bacillales bacterium]
KRLCERHGALLVIDEVLTGFRASRSGWFGVEGVAGDLMTFGKVMGGGLPAAAFGGRADVMDHLAPAGPVYQAGTLSGNPLAMTAGYATLSQLTPEVYKEFERKADRLQQGIEAAAEKYGIPVCVNRAGSMLGFFFTDKKVMNYETAKTSNLEYFAKYYREMANQGIFLPPSQFEGLFLSTAHTDEDIEKTIAAVEVAFSKLKE